MAVERVAQWLSRHHPVVYGLVRPPWRTVMSLLGQPDYWAARQHFNYYRVVIDMARQYAPRGAHVIDVGANDTNVLQALDWFGHRVALDLRYAPRKRGIESVLADFMTYQPPHRFDLVLCLQVLEHLHEPAPFARKLLETGRVVIISVPYRWPLGTYADHIQDPVDEAKLRSWTEREPLAMRIVQDRRERLVAVYGEG